MTNLKSLFCASSVSGAQKLLCIYRKCFCAQLGSVRLISLFLSLFSNVSIQQVYHFFIDKLRKWVCTTLVPSCNSFCSFISGWLDIATNCMSSLLLASTKSWISSSDQCWLAVMMHICPKFTSPPLCLQYTCKLCSLRHGLCPQRVLLVFPYPHLSCYWHPVQFHGDTMKLTCSLNVYFP